MNDQATPSTPVGYLARLVERVTPTEPTLRRRQPALFEGTHAALAEPALQTVDARVSRANSVSSLAEPAASRWPTTVQAPTLVPSLPPSRPPQDHAASTAAPLATVPHETPRVDSTVGSVTTEAPARAATAPSPTVFAPTPASRAPASRAEQPAAPAAALHRPAQALQPEATARPRHAPKASSEAPIALTRAEARTASVAAAARPKPTAAPAVPAATPPPRPAPPPALSPRNAARRQAATAPQPAPRAAARELPPIEITIGRIEVRAVTGAPSTPRGSTAAAPKLSLDQYLFDRGGQR